VTVGFPNNVAIGDTFVRVPLKQGFSEVYIAGPGLWIDCVTFAANTSFIINVTNIDLSEAGKETADFYFGGDHFCYARA
jgi:hypothetical protein